ncbi:hypothetical protein C8R45DRAFT_994455 [Mycena sanguinolenta]|nr:hypothetical protein C8R45DRAFT_994455 [Mycena sanguinolenta]
MNAAKVEDIEMSIPKKPVLTLNEFPVDTLIHIQRFMSALDIITLRQCSKLMKAATSHRTVWLDALRRVCAAHEVSVLTYPLQNMSLRELEHAATSPSRFIAQISKQRPDEEHIPAFCTRFFNPRLPKAVAGSYGETDSMRLIPGGRYLVTATNSARISVWDLGYSPAAVINPYPLASTVLPFFATHLLIQPTKNHEGFRIVTLHRISNNLVDATVHEIFPAAASPSFKQVAQRRINSGEIQAAALHLDRFVYYCDFLLTIWDFVEDTTATVHLYQPLVNITVSRTTVIGRHENGIIVVDIPPLHPRGTPAADVVVEPITPLPMVSHIHDVFGELSELHTTQADWHTAPDAPVVLDVFGKLVDGWDAYARCVIKQIPAGDPDLPSALPVLMGVSRVPTETWDADYYGLLHLSSTHLVRTWPTGSTVMINSARVPTQREIEFESKTACLWEVSQDIAEEGYLYDLDPVSGRLVVSVGPTIRVLDYMLPQL